METAAVEIAETEIRIGTVLEFEETKFGSLKHAWNYYLIPAINALAAQWELLGMGEFTQSVFKGLQDGCDKAEEQYISHMEKELKKSKFEFVLNRDSLISSVPERLSGLKAAAENLKKAFNDAADRELGRIGKPVDFDQVEIIDGKPQLHEESLRTVCSITIQTENQAQVWAGWRDIQSRWNKQIDLLKSVGFDAERWPVYGTNGFVNEMPDGNLDLDSRSINLIRS